MIGAGIDSFYEYLLKGHVLFGDPTLLKMYEKSRDAISNHLRDDFAHYKIAHFQIGSLSSYRHDALGAFYPGLLVLAGDIEGARAAFDLFYLTAVKFGDALLPEAVNWHLRIDMNKEYNLRPELIESAYYLYQATRDPFYLKYGELVLKAIEERCRTPCGYAALGNAALGSTKLARTESFLLSETLKYLYLLFKEDHWLNRSDEAIVFSTEAHPLKSERLYQTREFIKCPSSRERPDDRLRLLQAWSVGINGLSVDDFHENIWFTHDLDRPRMSEATANVEVETINVPDKAFVYLPSQGRILPHANITLSTWPSTMHPQYFVSNSHGFELSSVDPVVILSRRRRRAFEPRKSFLNMQSDWLPVEFYPKMSPALGLIGDQCKSSNFPFTNLHDKIHLPLLQSNQTIRVRSFNQYAKTVSPVAIIEMLAEEGRALRWSNLSVRNAKISTIPDYAFDYIVKMCTGHS